MCQRNRLFKERTLEIAETVFNVKTLNMFFNKLIEFIKMLKLPTKYTDFQQVKKVTSQDIE
jgi:hypothetical protein